MKKTVVVLSVLLLTAMAAFTTSGDSKKEKGQPAKADSETVEDSKSFLRDLKDEFVEIPEKDIFMLKTEVTQKLYESVMGENPSYFEGENNPVEMVSWYDAIYFCNKLSEKYGLEPVYVVDGETDVSKWDYEPHGENEMSGEITQNDSAKGFRLPTQEEWEYAANGDPDYYAGSYNLAEVGWYRVNSGDKIHPVAQKKANGYGLYDMSGNVCEWCWDATSSDGYIRSNRGGGYHDDDFYCKVRRWGSHSASDRSSDLGFRIVCSASK